MLSDWSKLSTWIATSNQNRYISKSGFATLKFVHYIISRLEVNNYRYYIGSGSFDRVVAFDSIVPRFELCHRQHFIQNMFSPLGNCLKFVNKDKCPTLIHNRIINHKCCPTFYLGLYFIASYLTTIWGNFWTVFLLLLWRSYSSKVKRSA